MPRSNRLGNCSREVNIDLAPEVRSRVEIDGVPVLRVTKYKRLLRTDQLAQCPSGRSSVTLENSVLPSSTLQIPGSSFFEKNS